MCLLFKVHFLQPVKNRSSSKLCVEKYVIEYKDEEETVYTPNYLKDYPDIVQTGIMYQM